MRAYLIVQSSDCIGGHLIDEWPGLFLEEMFVEAVVDDEERIGGV